MRDSYVLICSVLLLAGAPQGFGAGNSPVIRPAARDVARDTQRLPPPVPVATPDHPGLALEKHGVTGGPREMLAFLDRGLPKSDRPLPVEPEEKTQLAIDAIARLGKARSREAVPVLSKIAALQLPPGVESLVQLDLSTSTRESQEAFRGKALQLLQYNAINALGLIGDPTAREIVAFVYQRETNVAAKIQYALNLASLGDTSGVGFLVEQIDKLNRRESAAAAKVFTMITGQDFGYTEHTASRARRARAKEYLDWWRANYQRFRPDQAAILERRIAPRSIAPFQPRTTRDLLKLATFYFDFDNKLGSAKARQRLKDAGRAMNAELVRIASDQMEDLDVRMEAMNWYYENNRSDSRELFNKLRRDENPEIVDKAKVLLDQIDSDARPIGVTAAR